MFCCEIFPQREDLLRIGTLVMSEFLWICSFSSIQLLRKGNLGR